MAQKIWDFAEPGYLEKQSSNLIANALNKEGFIIAKGIAGIPTAFTASLGSGKPVIAILGEYDALPEISQEAVPFRKPKEGGNGYGQACGHHLFGVASANAAMAIGDAIKAGKIKGTIRYYGCPAEEGGAAKAKKKKEKKKKTSKKKDSKKKSSKKKDSKKKGSKKDSKKYCFECKLRYVCNFRGYIRFEFFMRC